MKRGVGATFLVAMGAAMVGCGPGAGQEAARHAKPDASAGRSADTDPSAPKPDGQRPKPVRTEEELRAAMREKNPDFQGQVGAATDGQNILAVEVHDPAVHDISALAGLRLMALDLARCRVTDLTPLRGMPLRELYLEGNGVRDLGPLKGMPLTKLYLNDTRVDDLSPLKGAAELRELNLVGTRVSDLGPLEKTPLRMLWVSGCPVRDITPLSKVPLVSVTLADTEVSDLSPLKGHPTLKRLHIAGTEVTDLSALSSLRLTRLIFTPRRIKTGLEVARQMKTLTEIGTDFDRRMHPSQFWPLYEPGETKSP